MGHLFTNTLRSGSGPFLDKGELWQYWACFPSGQQRAGAKKWLPTSESVSNLWLPRSVISCTRAASFPGLAAVVMHLSLQALTQVVTIANTYKQIRILKKQKYAMKEPDLEGGCPPLER